MIDNAQMGIEVGSSLGQVGTVIKDGIVGSLQGLREIEAEMVSLIRHTVSDTLRATGTTA
jgi:hypothetical protein